MAEEKFWVIEFRFPIMIHEASSPEEATLKAAKLFENEHGVRPSSWFARAFKYGKDAVGPVEEYFFNPAGVKSYQFDKNHLEHEEIIKHGRQDRN